MKSLRLARHVSKCLLPALCVLIVAAGTPRGVAISPADYAQGTILVRPKSLRAEAALESLNSRLQCKAVARYASLGDLHVVRLPPGADVPTMVAKYKASGLVEFAEPDYLRHIDGVSPNDPKYTDGTLWGLNNVGQSGGTPHADIDAPDAWAIQNSASNIVVALLDTGIRYTHEDLAANVWNNPVDGTHGTNAIAGTTDPTDDNGHGTLLAGVIGGAGNNGKGIVGVTWRVQLMACKCFNSSGVSSDSAILGCIAFAQANGARIINASFDSTSFGQALSNAIYSASTAGIIFVTSAGNNATNIDAIPHYPACYKIDNILSLAYTTRNDALGRLSNFGTTNVALAAPGDQMYSTFYSSDSSYWPSGISINIAGTSFAAAYASGACALLLAKYPTEPYQITLARILDGVDPIAALQGKCITGGRLNVYKALNPPLFLSPLPSLLARPVLRVSGGPNRTCVVETSSNLNTWTPVYTNTTSLAGTFDFSDGQSPTTAGRFYRATSAQ